MPPAEPVLAMVFDSAETYLAKLPLTDQRSPPVGSHTTPSRGLQALSRATTSPALLTPSFLSNRSPRFAVSLEDTRQLSLKKTPWVRKFVPRLSTRIGFHWITVVGPLRKTGVTVSPVMIAEVP